MKARSDGEGFRRFEAWLEGSDLLILKRDLRPPMVVMDFEIYARLLHSALAEHWDHRRCSDVLR